MCLDHNYRVLDLPKGGDIEYILDCVFSGFMRDTYFDCGLFIVIGDDSDITVISSYGLSKEPFNGTKKPRLNVALDECKVYSSPHFHKIVDESFWHEVNVLKKCNVLSKRVLYMPVSIGGYRFVVLLFIEKEKDIKPLEEIYEVTDSCVEYVYIIYDAWRRSKMLQTMSDYVKEVGHQMATSVQMVISKIHNIKMGYESPGNINNKLKQVGSDIVAAYRIADTLGITVDPNYNIRDGREFDFIDVVNKSKLLCESEADGCNIGINIKINSDIVPPLIVWGDRVGIEAVISQMLMNAIKYAKECTTIKVFVNKHDKQGTVKCSVQNVGISLDEIDKQNVWEFGYRGKKAKELNVNGSGIGLYTVKKIVTAHAGSVNYLVSEKSDDIVTFSFVIPMKEIIKKTYLL